MEDGVYFDVRSMNEACFDCRYNSGGKSFSEVTSTKHLSVSIDAVVIHNALWKTSAKPPQKRWNTGHAPNKVKAELPKLFNSMKKRRAALKGNPAVMRYTTTEASHLSYYDALIPSYRILSKCLRDLYENTCDLLFYTYTCTRKISMLFNIKQYTNKEFILISTRLLLTVSSYIYVLFLHTQLSGIFIFIFNAY